MLSIFNSSVKKLTIDTSWKNKILKITAQKFRMGINFSESSLQTQYFFIVWNKKQMIFLLGKTRLRERKSLNLKKSTNTFTRDTKLYQITYILCKTLSSVSIDPFLPTDWHQRNLSVTVTLQSPFIYSKDTSTLLLTFELCYKPLGIFPRAIKNK